MLKLRRPFAMIALALMTFGAMWACAQGSARNISASGAQTFETTIQNLAQTAREMVAPRPDQPDTGGIVPVAHVADDMLSGPVLVQVAALMPTQANGFAVRRIFQSAPRAPPVA
ncbi:MAG: hypothetical protein KKA05_06980 [Alphaproteobacteria bacterium]|nr:hypothetical protein [Alphaproteobacteria bacterium]